MSLEASNFIQLVLHTPTATPVNGRHDKVLTITKVKSSSM